MRLKRLLGCALVLALLTSPLLAHPGGLNKEGCHTCRKNCERWGLKVGEYHCHGQDKKEPREREKKQKAKKKAPQGPKNGNL